MDAPHLAGGLLPRYHKTKGTNGILTGQSTFSFCTDIISQKTDGEQENTQ
jgi:hypothetical protein